MHRRHEAGDALHHEAFKRPLVETVLLLHLHRADVIRPSSRQPKPLNDRSLWPGACSPVAAGAITTKGVVRVIAALSAYPPAVWALLLGTSVLIGLLAGLLG